jgi:uncharacterized protein YlxW (UPF0749 family)
LYTFQTFLFTTRIKFNCLILSHSVVTGVLAVEHKTQDDEETEDTAVDRGLEIAQLTASYEKKLNELKTYVENASSSGSGS